MALLFPFYLLFDRDLRVLSCGPSLKKSCPDLAPGTALQSIFCIERPRIPLTAEQLRTAKESLFVWKHLQSEFRLRGQLVEQGTSGCFLVLGSPWIREAAQLRDWNLTIGDFAVHDPTPEFTQFAVSQRLAMEDLRRISSKFDRQRMELRQALEEIRTNEQRRQLLAEVVEHSTNAVVVTDAEGRIEWANERFFRLTGYSPEEITGRHPGSFLQGPRTDKETVRFMRRALEAREGFRCEVANYRKDGTLFWNSMQVQPLLTESGRVRNFFGILSDVSFERETAARRALMLRLTRIFGQGKGTAESTMEILAALCEATGACWGALWTTDQANRPLLRHVWPAEATDSVISMAGVGQATLQAGEVLAERVLAENRLVAWPALDSTGLERREETVANTSAGSAMAFPIRTASAPTGVIGIFYSEEDQAPPFLAPMVEPIGLQVGQFLESRRSEEERARLFSLLQSALESAPEGVVVSDLRGKAVRINALWYSILEIDAPIEPERWREELTRRIDPTAKQMAAWQRQVADINQSVTCGYRLLNGRTLEIVTNPHRYQGETVGQIWLFRDITQRLAAQNERDRLLATLDSTLEATNDGILVTGLNRAPLMCNRRFLEMWRLPPSAKEAVCQEGLSKAMLAQLKDPEVFLRTVGSLFDNPEESAENRCGLVDGRIYDYHADPLRLGGRVIGRVWSFRDVSEQEKVLAALQESRESYRFVAETAPDSIVTFDAEGVIRFANQSALHRFGGTESGLVGVSVRRFFPEAKSGVYQRLLERLLREGVPRKAKTFELWLIDAQGASFPAELNIDQSPSAQDLRFTAVIRDISQRKNIEAQIRQAAREAELASRAKSDFLANISHEIRTPLNAIVGLSEMLRNEHLSRNIREAIDSIWVSSESLLALLNDLLDISKIEAGQIDLAYQDFDAVDICEKAVDVVRVRAAAKALAVYLVVEPPSPPVLRGDPNRIRQVLVNLLSNAVKFTAKGAVTLRVHWEATANGVDLTFTVSDTGVGIPASEQSRIFDNFYRVSSPLEGNAGGVGLGLAICRAISNRLGGSLVVDSREGEGSSFSLVLPSVPAAGERTPESGSFLDVLLAAPPARLDTQMAVLRSAGMRPHACATFAEWVREQHRYPLTVIDEEWAELQNCVPDPTDKVLWLRMTGRPGMTQHAALLTSPLTPARLRRAVDAMGAPPRTSTAEMPRSQRPGKSHHVLLVEDNPAAQLHMERVLEASGYAVTIGSTAAEAMDLWRAVYFDLVLMDIQLPDGNGIDLIREFRQLEQAQERPHTPIVVLSAHALARYEKEAMEAGADSYLAKPIRQRELLAAMRAHLRNRQPAVFILGETAAIVAKVKSLIPDALPLIFSPSDPIEFPAIRRTTDIAILAANSPSRDFVESALQALGAIPACKIVLIGSNWSSELVDRTGCGPVSPLPETAEAAEDLLRPVMQQERLEAADWQSAQELEIEIAGLMPRYLDGLRDSIAGTRRNLETGRMEEVARFAHRLKGTGGAYGFPDLTKLAAELEAAATASEEGRSSSLLSQLEREVFAHCRRFANGSGGD